MMVHLLCKRRPNHRDGLCIVWSSITLSWSRKLTWDCLYLGMDMDRKVRWIQSLPSWYHSYGQKLTLTIYKTAVLEQRFLGNSRVQHVMHWFTCIQITFITSVLCIAANTIPIGWDASVLWEMESNVHRALDNPGMMKNVLEKTTAENISPKYLHWLQNRKKL